MAKGANFCPLPMGKIFKIAVLLFALAGVNLPVWAQLGAVPPPMPAYQPLSPDQLDQLLGPIALYPDPLIAQILPAATLPTQIVLADRYMTVVDDPNQIDQQPWDPSVQALAHYPDVLQYLDDNLDWTAEVGQAFLNQQQDVMDSIQRLRAEAQNAGNLQSTPQQQVVDDNGCIEILPAEPDVVYVPVYQPDVVYSQGGFGISFGVACPIGVWLNCDFDWHNRHLVVWDRNHPQPAGWWHQPPAQRTAFIQSQTTFWRPEDHRANPAYNLGDRGWNNQPVAPSRAPAGFRPQTPAPRQNTVTVIGGPANSPRPQTPAPAHNIVTVIGNHNPSPQPSAPSRFQTSPNRPDPAPAQRYQVSNPAANGAFIGVQSSQQTRDYSDRGRQSMQTAAPPAPAARPAPASRPAPSSGGGGGHAGGGGGGGSPSRH